MRRIGSAVAVALVLVGAAVRPATAQILNAVPLGVVPTGTGIMVGVDYGKPEGDGSAYGLTGGLALSRIGAQVSVGTLDPGAASNATSFGGQVGMRLFGGGLNPVAIGVQGGIQSFEISGSTVKAFPVGATVRISPPLFPLKPWGVAYYNLSSDSGVQNEARISVGADFNLILGLGVHAAYDWGDSGSAWGIGAHFKFSVPGM